MDFKEAQKLKNGDRVECAAERGNLAFVGIVRDIDNGTQTRMGLQVLHITIEHPDGHKSIWPHHLLCRPKTKA